MQLDHKILSQLPPDFEWHEYLSLNPDLIEIGMSFEHQAVLHYLHYGRKEDRIYSQEQLHTPRQDRRSDAELAEKYKDKLGQIPADFDCRLYRIYNPDLTHMSNHELMIHYIVHGQKEARVYYSGVSYEELISQQKQISFSNLDYRDPILLINHDVSRTGAPIFLYDLYDYITKNNKFKNVHILEPFPNNILPNHPSKLYHYNDIKTLRKILQIINPCLIYSNSLNLYLFNFDEFKSFHYKTIIHFHEVYEDAINDLTLNDSIQKCPIYTVSEKIKRQFTAKHSDMSIDVFPPFIPKSKQEYILKQKNQTINHDIPTDKPIIGMCGDLNDRKNFNLFYRLALENTQYNFLWVGGKDIRLALKDREKPDNLYWIPHIQNPYPYLNLMDYFFLTSKRDPCPIVVLEALLLNKKVIVIKDNIYTQHDKSKLEGYYELSGKSEDDICRNFSNLVLAKNLTNNATNRNTQYVEENYTEPVLFNKCDKIERPRSYVVLSVYSDNGVVNDIDYYCNLINQFILRHHNFTYFVPIISISSDFNDIFGDNLKKYFMSNVQNLQTSGHVLFKQNKGYDIGGLLQSLDFINQNYKADFDNPRTQIAYLHNKNNRSWRDVLHKIFYTTNIQSYDTVTPAKFTSFCNLNDLNRDIMKEHSDIFDIDLDKVFKYVAGTCFITKLKHLKPLAEQYSNIEPLLTDINKDDKFWQKAMSDKQIFDEYVNMYQHDIYNSNLDINSHDVVKKSKCKNYIELYDKFKIKGIPDLQIEHALERYIGYLTLKNNYRCYKVK